MSFSEYQKTPKRFSREDFGFVSIAALGVLVLLGANFLLAHSLPPSGEFLLIRAGGRAFLFDKIEPYGPVVPAQVQDRIYGRSAKPGDEPYILDIPFHLMILYFPFSLGIEVIARGIYFFVLEAALFFVAFFGRKLAIWESGWLRLLLFFVVSLLNYYSITAFLAGAPTIFLGLIFAGLILLLRSEEDELAGVLTALAGFQWEVGAPFLLLILFYVFRFQRWRVLLGFGMAAFLLLVASYLWYPGWTIPFMRAAYYNWIADFGFSMHRFIGQVLPSQAVRAGWFVTGLLASMLGYEWSKISEKDFRRFYWTVCLTLAMTPLLGFRLEIEQLVILILPLGLILEVICDRWSRFGNMLALAFLLFYFAAPWLLFIQFVPRFGGRAEDLLFLFLPLLTVVSLYWIRWWAIRPPRTWFDQAGHLR